METKTIAEFEKNILTDILSNINNLMDKYKELKSEKDLDELNMTEKFKEENRQFAENVYLYYNNLLHDEEEMDEYEDYEEEDIVPSAEFNDCKL